jgi:L-amino acid N-acyltransferase YncA
VSFGTRAGIRCARPEDAAAIAEIYGPYVAATPISLETVTPTADQIGDRMARLSPDYPWLVYEVGGALKGYAYAGPHSDRGGYRWSANASVYVARDCHRQGIGRALYERLLSVLRRQGFHAVFGGITLPNPASVGLHESCGFAPVGVYRQAGFKLGAWWDVGWWGRILDEAGREPAPPKAFSAELLEVAPPASDSTQLARGEACLSMRNQWVWCR